MTGRNQRNKRRKPRNSGYSGKTAMNNNINRTVNRLVLDDEKAEKKAARRKTAGRFIPIIDSGDKPNPGAGSNHTQGSREDFYGKAVVGENHYGDEYYDKNAIKKIQKKRRPKKQITKKAIKRRKFILGALVILTVAAVGVVLSLTVFFKTQGFVVNGKTRYSEKEIVAACGISKGENIFLTNKNAAQDRIVNAFPYISEADVTAEFPNKIKITVTEGKQSYAVKFAQKQFCVISQEGRILKISKKKIKGLPVVKGVTPQNSTPGECVDYGDDSAATALKKLTDSLTKNKVKNLSEINVKKKSNISFTYDNRIKVKLGLPEDIDYKVRTAMVIIKEKLDPNNTGVIAGTLDVSSCNTTKKSYFNEDTIVTEPQKASASSTEPATDAYTDYGYSGDVYQDYTYYDDTYNYYGADGDYYDYGADGGYYDYGAGQEYYAQQ